LDAFDDEHEHLNLELFLFLFAHISMGTLWPKKYTYNPHFIPLLLVSARFS
jgi:hypothetical protein